MNRAIGVSMRVETIERRRERTDTLDQRLISFLVRIGYQPVPIPNLAATIPEWLSAVPLAGFVLSGGNDLCVVGGDSPERDTTETNILRWATLHELPVVGICRGMQMIATVGGATLERRPNHAAVEHEVNGALAGRVPSHHNWCVVSPPTGFEALAYAGDGSVEAIRSHSHRVLGMMWHPERMDTARQADLDCISHTLGGEMAE